MTPEESITTKFALLERVILSTPHTPKLEWQLQKSAAQVAAEVHVGDDSDAAIIVQKLYVCGALPGHGKECGLRTIFEEPAQPGLVPATLVIPLEGLDAVALERLAADQPEHAAPHSVAA